MKTTLINAVSALQKGNQEAFQEVYNGYAQQVYFVALKLLGNEHNAEEVTQDVFLYVHGKIAELKEPQAFSSWLNRIVTHKCTDFLRKNNPFNADVEEVAESEFEETDRSLIPDDSLDDAETAKIIAKIVDELPLPQKVCVYYYYYEGLSVREIADELAIKETTVKNRLALARDKIRRELERLEHKEGIKLFAAMPFALAAVFKNVAQNTQIPLSVSDKILTSVVSSAGTAATTVTTTAGTATTTATATAGTASTATTAAGVAAGGTAAKIAGVAVAVAMGVFVYSQVKVNQIRENDIPVIITTADVTFTYAPDSGENSPFNIVNEIRSADFEYTYDESLGGLVITKYIGGKTDVVIPDNIYGDEVKKIGDEAFKGNAIETQITSVTIPSSVVSIGDLAFANCGELTNVTIPDSVTELGNNIFVNDKSLKFVNIPSGVTHIPERMFAQCGFTNFTIPNTVTSIGEAAFSDCVDMVQLVIPDSVTKIGESAFWQCTGLKAVTVPESVTEMGMNAFAYCDNLTVTYKGVEYVHTDKGDNKYLSDLTAAVNSQG